MTNPFSKNSAKMPLVHRNDEIQAFSSQGSNQAFTKRVRFRRLRRGSQHPQPEPMRQCIIETGRKDRVAIMDQRAMRGFNRHRLANLLQRPLHCRMRGHVALQDPSRCDLQNQKHIDELKLGRDNHHEVAGDNGRGVVPDECRPVLRGYYPPPAVFVPFPRPVLADRPRRNQNAQLQVKLGRHPASDPKLGSPAPCV